MGSSGPIIIEPDWVLAADGSRLELLQDREVVIRGQLIEDVRERRPSSDQRVAAPGQLLMPGLISAHTHCAAGTAGRGLSEGTVRSSGLSATASVDPRALRGMEVMEALSDEDLDDLTAGNLVTLLRGGCTTQIEMSLSPRQAESYVRVAGRLGARGYPAAMVPQISRVMPIWARTSEETLRLSVPETLSEIDASRRFGQSIDGAHDDRIRPMMAVTVTAAHTRETLLAVAAAAEELGSAIHLHLQSGSGPNHDSDIVLRACGEREVPLLDELGLLDRRVFAAHLGGIDLEVDLPRLARPGFTFVHCPSAGGAALNPASQPYPEALAMGVRAALGLDAHSGDLVENIKLAVIQGRAREQLLADRSALPLKRPSIWDAVRSATLGPANGLERRSWPHSSGCQGRSMHDRSRWSSSSAAA